MAREKRISQNPSIAKDELLVKLGFREMIDITKLLYNEGQIDGVPKNPRYLKESEHDKLVKSLADSPELLEYKPLMVYGLEDGTDIDELFEDAQNTESKAKDIKLSVHIPQELEDKVDEIKEIIKSAVSEYEGVEIK